MDAPFSLSNARGATAQLSSSSGREVPHVDGRRLRSERTRQSIIAAFVLLLRENPYQMPTAVQIAERAGYSVRSIFQRFPDLPALRIAAIDVAIARVLGQLPDRKVDADRATRIRDQVEMRGRVCEEWLPLYRALVMDRSESTELDLRIRRAREETWKRLELMYWDELSSLSDVDRRELLITLEALTDYESWARMRGEHGLTIAAACEVWIHAIDRLLPPTPSPVS
jgi:AcrR family transcriptional regulator